MLGLPTNILFIIVVLLFVFLTFFVVTLVFINSYSLLTKIFGYLRAQSHEQRVKEVITARNQARKIVEDAQEQSFSILSKANSDAAALIASSEMIHTDAMDKMNNNLNILLEHQKTKTANVISSVTKDYQKIATDMSIHAKNSLQQSVVNLDQSIQERLSTLISDIDVNVSTITSNIEKHLNDYKSKVETEITNYKDLRIKELNNQLLLEIQDAVKVVLSSELDLKKYEEIILNKVRSL